MFIDLKLTLEKSAFYTFRGLTVKMVSENIIPDKNNIDDAVNVYYQFYTKEQEKEF